MSVQEAFNRAHGLLGKKVIVRIGDDILVRGKFLTFADSGDFHVEDEMGFVHYCWPLLDIEEDAEGGDW